MKKKKKKYSLMERNRKCFASSFKKPQKNKSSSIAWVCLIFFFLILLIFLLLSFSDFLHIKEIEINASSNEKEEKIRELVLEQKESKIFLFEQKNLLFFNKKNLIEKAETFNFLSFDINKNYFEKKLEINIEERKKSFIFKERDFYFFVDRDSYIISKVNDCESLEEEKEEKCLKIDEDFKKENLYPIIKNTGKDRFNEKEKKIDLNDKYIDFSLKLYNDLGSGDNFALKNIILDNEFNTIKAELKNGLELYFSPKHDYSEQISQFYTLKRDREDELKNLQYIDLRYGSKVFYY
jgi:cell division septal protein FtsQ